METAEDQSTRLTDLWLTRAVDYCVLLAFVILVASWSGLVVVIAGQVVRGWVVSVSLLLASLLLVITKAVRRRRAGSGTSQQPRNGLRPWGLGLMAITTGLCSAFGALDDLGATYHVLEPRGPGGCQAVVRETSFLMSGRGEVYAVTVVGLGWRASQWTTDDGYRPVAVGSYDLKWGGDGGVFTVSGSNVDPVLPSLHEVSCRIPGRG